MSLDPSETAQISLCLLILAVTLPYIVHAYRRPLCQPWKWDVYCTLMTALLAWSFLFSALDFYTATHRVANTKALAVVEPESSVRSYTLHLVDRITEECTRYWEPCDVFDQVRNAWRKSSDKREDLSGAEIWWKMRHLLGWHEAHSRYEAYPEWKIQLHEKELDAHADCLAKTKTLGWKRSLECWYFRHALTERPWTLVLFYARNFRDSTEDYLHRVDDDLHILENEGIHEQIAHLNTLRQGVHNSWKRYCDQENAEDIVGKVHFFRSLQTQLVVLTLHAAHLHGLAAWVQSQRRIISSLLERTSLAIQTDVVTPDLELLRNLIELVRTWKVHVQDSIEDEWNYPGTEAYQAAMRRAVEQAEDLEESKLAPRGGMLRRFPGGEWFSRE